MPKMIHPDVIDTIDVADEKAAVYAQQGWVTSEQQAAAEEAQAEVASAVTRATAKKPPAKRTAKKAAKKP